ncbi:MAG: F0F1 ATP synthase subunit alpha [Candidatus Nealsonbacteria bacterium DGGOD1a]|jgi:ATP synthase F1 subcomplex alpha subunit|nr:MAG: F0F1 ATP synthase subunit alpha [Candidatus Nealsonbacteria bacterium DGGOD1a]
MDKIEQFKRQLEETELSPKLDEIGEVVEVGDGVVKASGLRNVENFELVEFERAKVFGLAMNLEEYETGIIVLGDDSGIKEGDIVKRTKKTISVPVGKELVGRVVDPLGRPIDGKGPINAKEEYLVERPAPGVIDRQPVKTPLHTGILAIDSLVPIGRGQRELILGDRGLGKTAIAVDMILNQKNDKNRPVCIYVACGQKKSKVKRMVKILEDAGAMEYTIVVAAFADDPAALLYLAPYAGCAMGEWFRDNGQDAIAVYDDLTKQAWAWREISLVLRRPPGREAYPGDIFYLHSRLLERAARMSAAKGGGSLTALPIVETQAGDISGYIPTNVISITDGQIFLSPALFYKGQRPAIDVGTSVSRVGSSAQLPATKKVAGTLKLDLAQFQELERFSEFTEELDPQTRQMLERGKRMRELLKQADLQPLPFEKETAIIFAGVKGFLDDMPLERLAQFKIDLIARIEDDSPEILKTIRETEKLESAIEAKLEEVIKNVKKTKSESK